MSEPLVERHHEMGMLRHLVRALRAGRSAFVEVTGPPGYGRTAVLSRAVALARGQDVRVIQVTASGLAEAGDDVLTRFVVGLGVDADPYRHRLAVEACEVFLASARERPLMLVLDDAQWMDTRSRHWLRAMLRRLTGAPLLLVVATSSLGTAAESMFQELSTEAAVAAPEWHVLRLRPLTAQGVGTLLRDALPAPVDEQVAASLVRSTRGVPVVLRAVLTAARDVAAADPVAGRPSGDDLAIGATEARSDWVARVLRVLPAPTIALARAVAVGGAEFDWTVLCSLAGLPPAVADRCGQVLRRIGLAAPNPPVRLVDPDTAEQVLAAMTQRERQDLHARAFDLGLRSGVDGSRLAQVLLGAPTGVPSAVWTLRSEAVRLRSAHRPEGAARLLERALREPCADEERARLLIDLADTEASYAPEASDRRLVGMLAGGEGIGWPARLRAADMLAARGRTAVAQRVIAAAAQGSDVPAPTRATLIALYWMTEYAIPDAAAPRVPDLPPLPAEPADPVSAGVAAWWVAVRGRDRERARERARTALAVPVTDDGPLGPRMVAAATLLLTGDTEEARAGLDTTIVAARRNGMRALAAWSMLTRSALAVNQERWDDAARDLDQVAEELPRSCWHPMMFGHACAVSAAVHLRRGRPDAARQAVLENMPTGADHSMAWAHHLFARGLVRMVDGEPEQALEHFLECGRRMLARQWTNPALLSWRVMAGLAHHACGHGEEAARLATEEWELARAWGSPGYLSQVRPLVEIVLGRRPADD